VISQTGEYALRAIVDLAYHHGSSRTARQVAVATKVPAGYLAKVLQDLVKAGLVESQRGLRGGFSLARDPDRVTIYDVLLAVDPPARIRACPLGLAAHKSRLCPLHKRLDEAMAAAEKAFRETTIAEVTADPTSRPLREHGAELTISGGLSNRR
jgi:Rrf2 family nitric oxide-sensitive transcriptional repressor